MKIPMVAYFAPSGPTPAIVLKIVAPDLLNLFVIHQTGRTEMIERVHRCDEPLRGRWNYFEEESDGTEETNLPDR